MNLKLTMYHLQTRNLRSPTPKYLIECKGSEGKCGSLTERGDLGYSADESDIENVPGIQQKCSNKQKKIKEDHRCDTDTNASENSLY